MESTNDNKINFILPGFLNISRNEILINIYENYCHITMDNSCIHSFYGNFPSCVWNGGRLCLGERYTKKQIKKIKVFHNKKEIRIALTMTNLCLDESHLSNRYANAILKIFHDGYNEVLVSIPILENYIRKNFSKFKINKSITSRENPLKRLGEYNLSLIPSQHSNNVDYINRIPQQYKNKIEVLCNDPCITNCKYKYIHYEELCQLQLGKYHLKTTDVYGNCRQMSGRFYDVLLNQRSEKLFLGPKQLQRYVNEYNIKYFKINGREKYSVAGYENIAEFCIKEVYKYDVLCFMLERMMLEYEREVIYQTKKYGIFANENENLWFDRMNVAK